MAKNGFGFLILLLQPPKFRDHKHGPPGLTSCHILQVKNLGQMVRCAGPASVNVHYSLRDSTGGVHASSLSSRSHHLVASATQRQLLTDTEKADNQGVHFTESVSPTLRVKHPRLLYSVPL